MANAVFMQWQPLSLACSKSGLTMIPQVSSCKPAQVQLKARPSSTAHSKQDITGQPANLRHLKQTHICGTIPLLLLPQPPPASPLARLCIRRWQRLDLLCRWRLLPLLDFG